MPINTIKCPHCGARVNHTVKLSKDLKPVCNSTLTCPRCKQEFRVEMDDVTQRTLSDTKELAEFTEKMEKTDSDFERFVADIGQEDTVEEALNKADAVFHAAKSALDDISLDNVEQSIDAEKLLETYSVPDVKQFAMGKAEQAARKAQDKYNIPDEFVDAAMDVAENKFDNAVEEGLDRIASRMRKRYM